MLLTNLRGYKSKETSLKTRPGDLVICRTHWDNFVVKMLTIFYHFRQYNTMLDHFGRFLTRDLPWTYHGVREVYHGVREVYHGVREVYHGLMEVSHGVRKAYDGVREVYHGVREVYHGAREIYHGVREVHLIGPPSTSLSHESTLLYYTNLFNSSS